MFFVTYNVLALFMALSCSRFRDLRPICLSGFGILTRLHMQWYQSLNTWSFAWSVDWLPKGSSVSSFNGFVV